MSVIHQNSGLVISLESTSPEATHNGLIKGIINSLKFQMQSPEPMTEEVKEGNIHLLDLLEKMMPNEKQLRSMNKGG